MTDNLRKVIRSRSEFYEKLISRIELLGLFLSLLAVFFIFKKIHYASPVLIAGLSLLSFVYAFLGIFLNELFEIEDSGRIIKAIKASYLALALATIGMLFGLQFWAWGELMLYTGASALVILAGFLIYQNFTGGTQDYHKQLINNLTFRILPALLIAGFLILSYK